MKDAQKENKLMAEKENKLMSEKSLSKLYSLQMKEKSVRTRLSPLTNWISWALNRCVLTALSFFCILAAEILRRKWWGFDLRIVGKELPESPQKILRQTVSHSTL